MRVDLLGPRPGLQQIQAGAGSGGPFLGPFVGRAGGVELGLGGRGPAEQAVGPVVILTGQARIGFRGFPVAARLPDFLLAETFFKTLESGLGRVEGAEGGVFLFLPRSVERLVALRFGHLKPSDPLFPLRLQLGHFEPNEDLSRLDEIAFVDEHFGHAAANLRSEPHLLNLDDAWQP
jgi:hypothetical protein